MATTMPKTAVTTLDNLDVIARPKSAKATLRDDVSVEELSSVVMDVAKTVYGKQGAAAAALGKDEGNFSRDLKAGRFTLHQQAALGRLFLGKLGQALQEQYGALDTPQARARQKVREVRAALNELDQFLEHIA